MGVVRRFFGLLGLAGNTASAADWAYKTFLFLGTVSSFGVGSAYAAAASKWLESYGPIGWLVAGVAGASIFLLLSYFALWVVEKWTLLSIRRKALISGDAVDPMASQYYNKRIHIRDILPPTGPLRNKTFERCQIIGPLNIFPIQTITERSLYTNVDWIVVDPAKLPNISNAVVFDRCIFRECQIFNVSFLVNTMAFEGFDATGGCNWITHTPREPAPWIQAVAERLEGDHLDAASPPQGG